MSTPSQPSESAIKRYVPWVVATALFMEQLDSTIINTAVPAMAESLQVTPLSLKAVVTSYILSLAVCIRSAAGWPTATAQAAYFLPQWRFSRSPRSSADFR